MREGHSSRFACYRAFHYLGNLVSVPRTARPRHLREMARLVDRRGNNFHSKPTPPPRRRSISVDARHAHCHQLAQSLSHGGEQECTGAALAVDIQSLHIQRLYTPTPSHDGRTAPVSQCGPEGNTSQCAQGGLSARSLGEQSQRAPRPRCPGRHT